MPWHGIYGHDAVVERFRRALGRGRLASSFLFAGPVGVGKRTFALKLAQALLCETRPEADLDPCGGCPACAQVGAQTHPDLFLVAKPADRAFVPLELLIGDKEHRMREGLCHDISLKPFRGGRRVAILDDADFLNAEGANCLLKTLEEPPPRSVLILLGTSPARQLPTIRSRCQIVRFAALPEAVVADLLVEHGHARGMDEARRIAAMAEGSLARAIDLAGTDVETFRQTLVSELARPALDSVRLAATVMAFVDEAGREAARRRDRLRQVLSLAAEHYRGRLRPAVSATPRNAAAVSQPSHSAPSSGTEGVCGCLERCLDALEQVDRNAHPTTLVECWLDDLARIAAGDSP
ncbi:MAG: DNA polymerase III subunit [Pirellulales bacterium]|nr:DNA polymerase III subunit [Pirellulales bacterium]